VRYFGIIELRKRGLKWHGTGYRPGPEPVLTIRLTGVPDERNQGKKGVQSHPAAPV